MSLKKKRGDSEDEGNLRAHKVPRHETLSSVPALQASKLLKDIQRVLPEKSDIALIIHSAMPQQRGGDRTNLVDSEVLSRVSILLSLAHFSPGADYVVQKLQGPCSTSDMAARYI